MPRGYKPRRLVIGTETILQLHVKLWPIVVLYWATSKGLCFRCLELSLALIGRPRFVSGPTSTRS